VLLDEALEFLTAAQGQIEGENREVHRYRAGPGAVTTLAGGPGRGDAAALLVAAVARAYCDLGLCNLWRLGLPRRQSWYQGVVPGGYQGSCRERVRLPNRRSPGGRLS
jgi:hypothetical protein